MINKDPPPTSTALSEHGEESEGDEDEVDEEDNKEGNEEDCIRNKWSREARPTMFKAGEESRADSIQNYSNGEARTLERRSTQEAQRGGNRPHDQAC